MLEELAGLAPGGGLAGSVVGLLVWFMKTSREDRKEYREALKAARDDFDARLKEERGRLLEMEMATEKEVSDLRRRNADVETAFVAEHSARRDAELTSEGLRIQLEHMTWRYKLAKGEEVNFD